jgi:hypothetical protein
MKAQDSSPLPDGLFTHFQGMQTEGLLIINWILSSIKQPDQLVLTAI